MNYDEIQTTVLPLADLFDIMRSGAPVAFGELRGVIRSIHRSRKDVWSLTVHNSDDSETFTVSVIENQEVTS